MRYFVDSEYQWNADSGAIYPLSVGIVAEDGRELYLVLHPTYRDDWSPFLVDRVLPVLHRGEDEQEDVFGREDARFSLLRFFGGDTPEFWGDYADFDYVVLSMLMGGFDDWPEGWPMFINDCQQVGGLDVPPSATPHNALADARAIRDGYNTFWGW